MNTIIREIIGVDKAAQIRVDEAKAEREKAQNLMTAKREEIYAEFMRESQKEIDQKKAELLTVFETEKANSEKKYQTSLDALQKLFNERKDEWVKTIVEACLD